MKRALCVFTLLIIGLIASVSTITTRYFLTELDFITNQFIPESEIHFRPHLQAEYDEYDYVLKKLHVDQRGAITQTEIFTYDSTHNLKIKDIYIPGEVLLQQVLFGMEGKAVEYVEYVYGVDTVKDWSDRFSILDYNNISQLTNHAFYDVNAFQYGNAHFEYDSLGHLSKEEWIRHPSGKTMYLWNHFFDPVTQLTRIMEYDSTGVLVKDFRLNPDGTESIFWFKNLEDSLFVNHTNLVFWNESFLEWGKIFWFRVDESGGYSDSVEYELSEKLLVKGQFSTNMRMDSLLVDSATYDIVFTGKGTSGYEATKRRVNGITFDISPPKMVLNIKPFINEPKISYNHSEPLISVSIEWVAKHDSTHIISTEFDSIDLTMSGEGMFIPNNQLDLSDSVFYQVHIYGTDRAGNISRPTIIDSIMYDIEVPVVELLSPNFREFRNFTSISFSQNEPLTSWKIVAKSIAGVPDPQSPHYYEPDSLIFDFGIVEKDLAEEFHLNDGSVYRFELSAIDRAGNISSIFSVDSVTYDISPPILTTIYPASGVAINQTTISYSNNESLRAGEFRWEQTEGTTDSSAPHIIPLIPIELEKGNHIQVGLSNQNELTDGTVYSLMFVGQDLAGNDGIAPLNSEILFDAVPPEFTDIKPIRGSALNHKHVSYTLSEKVDEGSITWIWIGGVKDESAPHIVQLTNSEMESGKHDSIVLTNSPQLMDGGKYRLEFNAIDRAGNAADAKVEENILYDFTAPVMTVSYPIAMSFLPKNQFSYHLSETLFEGTFLLERTAGKEDPKSPYEITLTIKEKMAGDHDEIQMILMPDVKERVVYKLSFIGKDRANNFTVPFRIPGIQYDFTPPLISITDLEDSTDVNHLIVNYEFSELLKESEITWERTGGENDPKRIHKQSLTGKELAEGLHQDSQIINSPNLIDGAEYSISIFGRDRAGNESNIPIVKKIRYDITAPLIHLAHPIERTYISTPAIKYELSENLHKGIITYIQTGGSMDPRSPQVFEMSFDLRQKGVHENVFLNEGPNLAEGAIYTISIEGEDRAGNEASIASISGVIYDATPPELTLQIADSSLFVNHNRISFTMSENVESGLITWTQVGGFQDPKSPHKANLVGNELEKDSFINYTLTNAPQLSDGSIYTISFSAKDFAGNISETVIIENILYDISPPSLQIVSPGDNHITKGSELTLSISEDLLVGEILWEGMTADGVVLSESWKLLPHVLKEGQFEINDYYESLLEDGGTYSITFTGQDPAGNKSIPVRISNYRIDRTPPVFSGLMPISDSFVNQDHIGYSLSEDLQKGTILMEAGSGTITIPLQGKELQAGEHPLERLIAQPSWIDGNTYTLSFVGSDFANNVSDTVKVEDIIYDTSPPVFTISHPENDAYINKTIVNFSVNEPLKEGQMIWEPVSGNLLMENLSESNLLDGDHVLDDTLDFEEKVPYSIYFQGIDRAGNSGKSEAVTNVVCDITKPELTMISPVENSAVNHKLVSYRLDEDLQSGKIVWQDISGVDNNSVHEIVLKKDELNAGEHSNVTLNKLPELVDGASYMIRLEGSDLAGNINEAVPIASYTFDSSPPVFSDISPVSGLLINQVELGYSISEDLKSGKITFTRTDGELDTKSPHVVNLSGNRLKQGERGGVLPIQLVSLVNGAIYKIEYFGKDFAGNISAETFVENISFDNEPPIVFLKNPQSNTTLNNLSIDYLISEDMVSGRLRVEIDSKKELLIELKENEMKAGDYTLFLPQELSNLNDGIKLDFSLEGSDAAGNVAIPHMIENVKYDTTHPVIKISGPVNDDVINYTTISLDISEDLFEGRLSVIQTGGVFDSRSPQTIPLQLNERKSGSYEFVQLQNGPKLQNGSIYTYEFHGKDYAGNTTLSKSVKNILYDNEPPVISLSKPIDSEHIKNTEVSFIHSDNLSRGTIIYERTGGSTDPNSPHIVELEGDQLRQGAHMDVNLNLTNALADGSRYSVAIQGWDKAGNKSNVTAVTDVLFDVLPPVITIHKPENGDVFNEPIVSIEMNEKLAEGTLTFKQIGGVADPYSPHEVPILPPFNDQGRFDEITLANDITLSDGSTYSIMFNARDPAGNVSDPVIVSDIYYDITPPQISISDPIENSYLNTLNVTYSIDENIVIGQLVISQTLGTADPGSPHLIELTGDLLTVGQHTMAVHDIVPLVSKTEYSIQLTGQDKAGNVSKSNEVSQIVYDIEPPILQITAPLTNTKVNHTIIGFSLSETLQELSIIWVDDMGSEMSKILPEKYFLPERYEQVVLADRPILISGSIYSLILQGTDLAGNTTITQINNVQYDNTPPDFTIVTPASNSFINHTLVQFGFNEPLLSGQLIWNAMGGRIDSQSPLKVVLINDELLQPPSSPQKLSNQIPLNDGTIYQLSIHGIDMAGNENQMILAENILCDITPPTLQLVSPLDNSFVNSDNVEFIINEDLQSANLTWKRISGASDPNIHTIDLSGNFLISGTHSTTELNDLPLVSGAQYEIEISGTDLAGNSSTAASPKTANFDSTPPTLVLTEPQSGSFINLQNVAYTISEPLQSGALQFTNQGTGEMNETPLNGDELTTLNWESNPLKTPLSIEDGGTYTYKFVGTDLAGNVGESAVASDIRYDISKPIFTITRPKENYVNVESITNYSLNEDIVSGTATWVRTGGKILGPVATANRPQVMELVGEELLGGNHKNIKFTNSPQLNATTKYKLTLKGIDAAGNESLPASVDGIEFIPDISGNWLFQGAIMTVVWTFEPDEGVDDLSAGAFSQGMQMGTKISNQEFGRYTIDYSKVPWEMIWVMEKSGQQRFSIFEFRDNTHMKVLTKERKKPKNWRDGEIMLYEKE